MVLLESYFKLNKEQRKKFLNKEERKELKEAKKARKLKQLEEEEQQSEEEEIDEEELEKRIKKEKKKAKKLAKQQKQEEVEEEVEEEEQETEKKKKKKSKKEKKQAQEEEIEEEEEKPKKSKKDKKNKKKRVAEVEQEEEEEEQVEQIVKKQKKQVESDQQSTTSSSVGEQQQKVVGDDVDAAKWRKENELTISGTGCEQKKYNPFVTFKNTGMNETVMECTKAFQKPSLIQSSAWPIVLDGRDCIAIAETGSGKTLGFLLPAFQHILSSVKDLNRARFPRVVILSPTRELASQIYDVCQKAQQSCGIKSVCCYGGVSKQEQKDMLKQGAHIVIGTPGRMKDLMGEGAIKTQDVSMMVLDEADRMLDMGFAPDIKFIFGQVKPDRQSVMFSATWPKEVQEISREFLNDALMIKIGTDEGSANKRVAQCVEVIKPFQRNARLVELLQKYNKNQDKIIVFVLYKTEAARIHDFIQGKGYKVVALHGDMSQKARNAAFEQFQKGQVNVLVATDVAARGLDIPNVEHVINYSFPLTVSDYVHRIGRTGRAGKNGNSYTFFQESQDKKLAGDLVQIMKEAGQPVNPELEKFGPTIHKRKEHPIFGFHFKEVDMSKKGVKTKL